MGGLAGSSRYGLDARIFFWGPEWEVGRRDREVRRGT